MGHEAYVRPMRLENEVKTYGESPAMLSMIGRNRSGVAPHLFKKRSILWEMRLESSPAWKRTNGAMTPAAVMSLWQWRTADFQRRIYGVLWQLYEVFDLNSVEDAKKKSTIPVIYLGHRPEVEKGSRAAPLKMY